eukprot:gene21472-25120_t
MFGPTMMARLQNTEAIIAIVKQSAPQTKVYLDELGVFGCPA